MKMKPKYFKTQSAWSRWLQRNHGRVKELWVGFYKKDSGKPSITYPESLDEALCFGWIDGVRYKVDELSYTIRFTPRRKPSPWSEVNTRRVRELIRLGRMHPAGLKAFRDRDPEKTERRAHQRQTAKLHAGYEKKFRTRKKAWTYFQTKPPSYQRLTIFWVMSAKKDETRLRRLEILMDCSERGQMIPLLAKQGSPGKYG
jgi:uncharacterized protein YdeI (YjbR/CyaY-like superfamily)